MSSFHRVDQSRPRPGLPTETEGRLPLAQSVAVIAGLSALGWVVLIAIVMGLCGLLELERAALPRGILSDAQSLDEPPRGADPRGRLLRRFRGRRIVPQPKRQ